jgi:hypothetical protein
VVVIAIVIAMALLIHGCQVSQTNDSLKNYNAQVYSLINASDTNGGRLFTDLQKLSAGGISSLQTELNGVLGTARDNLNSAESLNAPSQMAGAQSALVDVMQLRYQGIAQIANNIQAAASKDTSKDAIHNMQLGTSQLYASDVMYKTFVTPDIAKALNGAGIPIGSGAGEQQINSGQILPDLGWLQFTFIAEKTGSPLSTSAANSNNTAPGLHGHSLNYVSVGTNQLSPTGTNTVAASPAPTFTLNLTNGGNFDEYDVGCQVSIAGLSDTGTATIPKTIAHQSTTCSVTLPSPPTPGTYSVTAQVLKVPRETYLKNNSITYSIDFK